MINLRLFLIISLIFISSCKEQSKITISRDSNNRIIEIVEIDSSGTVKKIYKLEDEFQSLIIEYHKDGQVVGRDSRRTIEVVDTFHSKNSALKSIGVIEFKEGFSFKALTELNNNDESYFDEILKKEKFIVKPKFFIVALSEKVVEVFFYSGFPINKSTSAIDKNLLEYLEKTLLKFK